MIGRGLAGHARERELWEHYGMALLYPFLFSFALLSCENVGARLVSGGDFDGDPRYFRPELDGGRPAHEGAFPPGRFRRTGGYARGGAYWATEG